MEDYELTPEEEDAVMAYLEEVGAMEWVGMDESGDRIMKPNFDKLKEFAPEIYEGIMEELNNDLMELYEIGLIEVSYDDNLDPMFSISPEGLKFMEEKGFSIEEDKND